MRTMEITWLQDERILLVNTGPCAGEANDVCLCLTPAVTRYLRVPFIPTLKSLNHMVGKRYDYMIQSALETHLCLTGLRFYPKLNSIWIDKALALGDPESGLHAAG
jgi:hypothetical protein